MEIKLSNTLKKDDWAITIFPCIGFGKPDENKFEIILHWIIFGVAFVFKQKKKIVQKIVTCVQPYPGLLTKNKEYLVIKELPNAYVIKRDDGSIDKMLRWRFTKIY